MAEADENTKKKWNKHAMEWLGGLVVFTVVRFVGDVGSASGFITLIQALCVFGTGFCLVKASKAPR